MKNIFPAEKCTNELKCRAACYILSKPMLIYTVINALQNQLGLQQLCGGGFFPLKSSPCYGVGTHRSLWSEGPRGGRCSR